MLALAGEPLGVVTAIAGQARGAKVFDGRADHAGTTPMDARSDALVEAARVHPARARVRHGRRRRDRRRRSRSSRTRSTSCPSASPSASTPAPPNPRSSTRSSRRSASSPATARPRRLSDAFAAVLPDAPRLVSGAGHDAMVLALAGVPELDALRAQPERRRQPPSRRALERRGHRARRRRPHGGTQ